MNIEDTTNKLAVQLYAINYTLYIKDPAACYITFLQNV